jgi:hypothetical protein
MSHTHPRLKHADATWHADAGADADADAAQPAAPGAAEDGRASSKDAEDAEDAEFESLLATNERLALQLQAQLQQLECTLSEGETVLAPLPRPSGGPPAQAPPLPVGPGPAESALERELHAVVAMLKSPRSLEQLAARSGPPGAVKRPQRFPM